MQQVLKQYEQSTYTVMNTPVPSSFDSWKKAGSSSKSAPSTSSRISFEHTQQGNLIQVKEAQQHSVTTKKRGADAQKAKVAEFYSLLPLVPEDELNETGEFVAFSFDANYEDVEIRKIPLLLPLPDDETELMAVKLEPFDSLHGLWSEETVDDFDQIYEQGIDFLLAKDYKKAYQAFYRANQIIPHKSCVLANLKRLQEMGFGE